MNKNKNINIKPSKGISIVIKNDFQPEIKQKKKRKYKKKVNTDMLKMPTVPSFIPQGDSFIKPQYNMSSLNRNVIFPGVPQSLPQLPPPPQLAQLMPPPTQQPTNANFENMLSSLGNMIMNSLMPIESGFKSKSYIVELDDDIIDALPEAEKNKYIENKIKPQIEKEIKDITFPDEDKKAEFMNNAISIKTSKEYGTKHANKLIPFDPKYNGNEYYKANYISRLQEIINQDSIKTRAGIKENTQENDENDDVLDYLQDVINKISEDDDFMKDLEKSKGSGKIKFYKKYLQVSALFKYNNVNKIKKEAWHDRTVDPS